MMASDAFAQRRDSDWVDLGCQTVSFRVDRDVLRVGRRDGRFGAIRLHARGGDVEMLDLKVMYGQRAARRYSGTPHSRRGDRSNPSIYEAVTVLSIASRWSIARSRISAAARRSFVSKAWHMRPHRHRRRHHPECRRLGGTRMQAGCLIRQGS